MSEHRLTVPRTALYHTLGDPGPATRDVWIVCHGFGQLAADFLRPFDAIASPERVVVAPEALNRFYLEERGGPHGPTHPVGATWMTRHDREAEIRDYVEYLDRLVEEVVSACEGSEGGGGEGGRGSKPGAAGATGSRPGAEAAAAGAPERVRPRLTALGFSQGAATAARWAALGRTPPPERLVLWGAGTPPDLDLARLGDRLSSPLVLVAGEADTHQSKEAVASERRRLDEAGVPHVALDHSGGHRLDRATLQSLAATA